MLQRDYKGPHHLHQNLFTLSMNGLFKQWFTFCHKTDSYVYVASLVCTT